MSAAPPPRIAREEKGGQRGRARARARVCVGVWDVWVRARAGRSQVMTSRRVMSVCAGVHVVSVCCVCACVCIGRACCACETKKKQGYGWARGVAPFLSLS